LLDILVQNYDGLIEKMQRENIIPTSSEYLEESTDDGRGGFKIDIRSEVDEFCTKQQASQEKSRKGIFRLNDEKDFKEGLIKVDDPDLLHSNLEAAFFKQGKIEKIQLEVPKNMSFVEEEKKLPPPKEEKKLPSPKEEIFKPKIVQKEKPISIPKPKTEISNSIEEEKNTQNQQNLHSKNPKKTLK
jgi:hypothetical protein